MKKVFIAFIICTTGSAVMAQNQMVPRIFDKDSALQAAMHRDSLKIERDHATALRWKNLLASVQFPVIKGVPYSGVFPVRDISEFPDQDMKYKLLFEIQETNPDSLMGKTDRNLTAIARTVNLHVAAGVPLKNISVVIVTHGPGNAVVFSNTHYREKFNTDNPNLKMIKDLENLGAKFIICGQSMDFSGLTKADLLPEVRIALSAVTTFTTYQLKGYILRN